MSTWKQRLCQQLCPSAKKPDRKDELAMLVRALDPAKRAVLLTDAMRITPPEGAIYDDAQVLYLVRTFIDRNS